MLAFVSAARKKEGSLPPSSAAAEAQDTTVGAKSMAHSERSQLVRLSEAR